MRSIRVANVVGGLSARQGGPAVALAESTRALRQEVVARTIFATDNAGPASAPYERIGPESFPGGPDGLDVRLFRLSRPYRMLRSRDLSRALLREVPSYDIVHIHGLYLHPHLAAYRACRRHDKPYVVSFHGVLDPFLRRKSRVRKWVFDSLWQRRLLQHAAGIHVATEDEQRLTEDIAPHVPRFVVPQGINVAEFNGDGDGGAFRREYLGGHAGPVILYIGRLSFKKGLDRLVAALPAVRERHDAKVVLVGPDDEGLRPKLERQAARLGVGDSVVFTGPLYGADRAPAFAAADVWTLPSHSENFGIAVVEALAAGLPSVIAEGVNVGPELARLEAVRVTTTDPADLAADLSAVLDDPAEAQRLRDAGRAAAANYDWQRVARHIAEMYEQVLGGRRG